MFFPLTPCSYALASLLFRNVVFPVRLLDLDVQFAAAFGDVVRLNPQGTDVHSGEGADFAAAVAGLIGHSGVGDFAEHGVFKRSRSASAASMVVPSARVTLWLARLMATIRRVSAAALRR